ncbi:polynucleotide kinase 3'-phosphatase isoform X1 [Megalopta genalis]|uniref:polynucleotide kinase 3'-phosphatase isoform X1 n=2 Tax=Megalopta genalis TaxID=115081 RepID=UPI003FD3D42D
MIGTNLHLQTVKLIGKLKIKKFYEDNRAFLINTYQSQQIYPVLLHVQVTMTQEARSCYLKSNDKILLTVHLPHHKPVIVGRCPETNITDSQCSRQQARLCADYQEYKVSIQQLGKRPCGFNGFKTRKDVKFLGKHEDCLEILYGKYAYEIEFNPPPPKSFPSEKRARDVDKGTENEEYSCKIAKFEEDNLNSNTPDKEEQEEKSIKNTETSILKFLKKDNMSSDKLKGGASSMDPKDQQNIWKSKENGALLMYTTHGVKGRSKIAAYDMDGTLIKTRTGLVFPKDYDDWQIIYSEVPGKLKKLHSDGYKIVIFTNQSGLGSARLNAKSFKNKIKNIVQRIGLPIQVFIATGHNVYRKPSIGMWQKLEENNESIPIDKANSFYVGDAAGRPKSWAPGKKKDHSLVDRLLAMNLGLKFYTPEEHFLGQKEPRYVLPTFNPRNIPTIEVCTGGNVTSSKQEVVLMVGCPASGKSHFVKNYLSHYGYVNRDTLGSWQKCISVTEKHLLEKNSVVVDNTNPDPASRQRYIEVAKKHGIPVRCFVMTTSTDHAKHNNKFRELTDPSHVKITEVIINSYIKNYQSPTLDEGFTEIVQVNCVPKFQKNDLREIYEMYLLES